MEVVLVVNNLGGTSNLELSIVTNSAIRYLGMEKIVPYIKALGHPMGIEAS